MKILFCIHDFQESNFRLQPWLTFYRIGKILASMGHQVSVLTDCPGVPVVSSMEICSVQSLRGRNSDRINGEIKRICPDIAVISVTPLSLVTSTWLAGIKFVRSYAYLSYPFYNFAELFKAFFHLNDRDKWSYGRHLLVPDFIWKWLLSKFFQGVIAQSVRTGNRVSRKDNKRIRVHPILPGIDKNIWFPDSRKHRVSEETIFLYTGSPKRIRGFNLILDAFSMLSREKIKLRILARGADQSEVEKIKLRLKQRGLLRHTQVIGGWMSPGQLRQHISNADAVLLPFILVPSELPVTVMEVIACGTPPIVSDIDGLPEAVGDCGMVVPQADAKQLAKAIDKFHKDSRIGEKFRSHCLERYNSMDSWEDTAKKWIRVFENTK